MKVARNTFAVLVAMMVCLTCLPVTDAGAVVAGAPAWSIRSWATPTNFVPGDTEHDYTYEVVAENQGTAVTDENIPFELTDVLPAGVIVERVELPIRNAHGNEVRLDNDYGPTACTVQTVSEVSTVKCTVSKSLPGAVEATLLHPSEMIRLVIHVGVPQRLGGRLVNRAEVEGGGAPAAVAVVENEASAAAAASGLSEFNADLIGEDGQGEIRAGSHPYAYVTHFAAHTEPGPSGNTGLPFRPAGGDLKDIEVALPPGLVGNPIAAQRCAAQQFNEVHPVNGLSVFQNSCADGSAIGLVVLDQLNGQARIQPLPLYNLIPPKGMPAQFGFQIAGAPIYIDTKVRSEGDYGVTAYLPNTSEAEVVSAASVTIWGVPADPSHDRLRGHCLNESDNFSIAECAADIPSRPFFRLPTTCDAPQRTTMNFNTWLYPTLFAGLLDQDAAPVDCAAAPFDPTLEAKPTTNVADAPSGLDLDLHLPQKEHEDPEGRGEADLKDATITLPPSLLVNPSSANGLGGCSEQEIGYLGIREGRRSFSAAPAGCPDAAKIGTVEVDTPLLEHSLPGAVYLANPFENPFDSLIALYIAVFDPQSGVVVKLPAQVTPDPLTGQLTTTVSQSPQLPFEDFRFSFFKGATAPLRTTATCSTSSVTGLLTPWSAPERATVSASSEAFQTTLAPGGGACPTSASAEPNAPSFEAGTVIPTAGAYSPFVLHLSRADGSQEFKGLNVSLPDGLIGKLAGISECSDAQIAQAQGRGGTRGGALERSSPSCPASSELGTVTVGAGAGPSPFYVQGTAYLAGPYEGAPLSMVLITPALAGPFDLGAVVVRVALQVDPVTTRITAVSDPIPTILAGIPLDVRSIAVKLDRPNFTLNPTSCEPKTINGEAISVTGQAAPLTNRFQVGGCRRLKFAPKLSLTLKGGTRRHTFPSLKAVLTYPKGNYANIARAQVTLPHSEFLEQSNIGTVCTRSQLASSTCPAKAIYGRARAVTPLLDKPLKGPVYLGVGFGHKLPDLVADLNGQIRILVNGKVDSGKGNGLRTTFLTVPDAPVSKFTLELFGGRRSLIVNSENICSPRAKTRAIANFTAQNGKVYDTTPVVHNSCKRNGGGGKKHHGKRHRR